MRKIVLIIALVAHTGTAHAQVRGRFDIIETKQATYLINTLTGQTYLHKVYTASNGAVYEYWSPIATFHSFKDQENLVRHIEGLIAEGNQDTLFQPTEDEDGQ